MSVDGGSGSGEVTLAFSLSAIDRLDEPQAAFEDARDWSRFVGIVDDDADAVAETVAEHDLQQDFELEDSDRWLALEGIRDATDTRRHVYVGATGEDRRVSTHLDWEYVHVTEAAEKADWTLAGEGSGQGFADRVLAAVPDRLWPLGGT